MQKAQKTLFFLFFAIFVATKCLEKREKTVFSLFLWDIVRKAQKTLLFIFFANFVQNVSKNVKKHCFLSLFVRHRAKSSKSSIIRIFCELHTKCLEKRLKTLFSHTFCGTSRKNLNLRTLYKVSRKTWKKTLFSHTFCGTSWKKSNIRCFLAFYANFVERVTKKVKNTLSSYLLRIVVQKAKNPLFSCISCELRRKGHGKSDEHSFFHICCETSRKKLKNRCFLAFYAKFVISVTKTWKLLFSHTFCGTLCKKLKNAFFLHFIRILFKMSRKSWINTVFSHFL